MSLPISPASAPRPAHFPAPNPDVFTVYTPADAARELGINEDTVTYHIAKRPKLFPSRDGNYRHEWSRSDFERVKLTLLSLCPKAKSNRQKHLH